MTRATSNARPDDAAPTPGQPASLLCALEAVELERADAVMLTATASGSVERAVEETLLPALAELCERNGAESATWMFAACWAAGWLHHAQRLGPPPTNAVTILIGDASGCESAPEKLAIRALELCLSRAGVRSVTLPVADLSDLGDLVAIAAPDAVVVAGRRSSDEAVARWVARIDADRDPLPLALFERASGRLRGAGVLRLPRSPSEASHALVGLTERHAGARSAGAHR